MDTLCPHRFDRSERCSKRFAVLETSQTQNAIAHFVLLRRTPPSVVLILLAFSYQNKKPIRLDWFIVLVGAGGFEPPKSKTTDLQSAPFGHSGTLPYLVIHWSWWTDATFFQKFAVLSASRSHFAPKNITP